jgi:hypothetical protein
VMATLAFFFALTGGTMAATKYLQASDPITQGDLAGSTYGNPVIADGKVTMGKIADGAITTAKFDSSATAPNATKLAGHPQTDFPLIVATGSITVQFESLVLPSHECATFESDPIPAADPSTDYVLVRNPEKPLPFNAWLARDVATNLPRLNLIFCNQTENGLSPDIAFNGTYRYLLVR